MSSRPAAHARIHRHGIGALAAIALLAACSAPDESDPGPATGIAEQALGSTCITLRRGTAGSVADTYVGAESPGSSYGALVVASSGLSSGFTSQALFRWDLSILPPGAVIQSATVALSQTNNGPASPRVHLVTAPWSEATVTWSSFAGAFDPSVIAVLSNASPTLSFDVTAVAKGWRQGTIQNHGLLVEQAAPTLTRYKTSEWSVLTQRPQLTVCYGLACAPGTADCDGDIKNGCETSLTTLTSCGACGVACALPNATASCVTGSCVLQACDAGTFDCDGDPANGCEPSPCGDGGHCAAGSDCASGTCQAGICVPPAIPVCDPAVVAPINALVGQANTAASVGDAPTANARYEQAIGLASCHTDALFVAGEAAARGYVNAANDAYAKALSLSGGQIAIDLDIAGHAAARGYVGAANNAYAAATAASSTMDDTLSVAAHAAARGYVDATNSAYAKAMVQASGQLAAYLDIAAHAAARGYVTAADNAYAAATAVSVTINDLLSVAAHAAARGYVTSTNNAYAAATAAGATVVDLIAVAEHAAARGYPAATNNAYAKATALCSCAGQASAVAASAAAHGYPQAANDAAAKAATLPPCP
ncbi:MAG: DNRLRE domain-containing protein [Byssovorax sp.]